MRENRSKSFARRMAVEGLVFGSICDMGAYSKVPIDSLGEVCPPPFPLLRNPDCEDLHVEDHPKSSA